MPCNRGRFDQTGVLHGQAGRKFDEGVRWGLEVFAHTSVLQHSQRRRSARLAPVEVTFLALWTRPAVEYGLDGNSRAVRSDPSEFMTGNHTAPVFEVHQIRGADPCRHDTDERTSSVWIVYLDHLHVGWRVSYCLHSAPRRLRAEIRPE
jgi:hypothetical protein